MKKFIYLLIVCGLSVGLSSCSEKFSMPEVEPDGHEANVLRRGLSAVCKPLPSETGDTKSSFVYGDVQKKKMIRSVRVFVFETGGRFVATRVWDNMTPVSVFQMIDIDGMLEDGILDEDSSYDYYFLANVPEDNPSYRSTISDIEAGWYSDEMAELCFDLQDYSSFSEYGFPMEARVLQKTVYEIESEINANSPLEFTRLVSQWKVTLSSDNAGMTFEPCDVCIRNIARSIQPFSDSPSPARIYSDSVYGDNDCVSIDGNSVYFYALENRCGEFFKNAVSFEDRYIPKALTNSFPTFIEVQTSATIDDTDLYFNNAVYRYVFGDGDVTNADVTRHTEYNLILSFTSTADENEGWIKEVPDPVIKDPYVDFESEYKGIVLDKIDAFVPFNVKTKGKIARGELISSEWWAWDATTRKIISSRGPLTQYGQQILKIVTTDTGVKIQPSETAAYYLDLMSSRYPQYSFGYVIRKDGITDFSELSSATVDGLVGNDNAEKNGNTVLIKIKSPNAGDGFYLRSEVTNYDEAFYDPDSGRRATIIPVVAGPIYYRISSGSGINQWNILSNSISWAQSNYSSFESHEAGLWAPFLRLKNTGSTVPSNFMYTCRRILNLPFYLVGHPFENAGSYDYPIITGGLLDSYIFKGRRQGNMPTTYNTPEHSREDDFDWNEESILLEVDPNYSLFGSEDWFDEVYYDSRYTRLGAKVELHYYNDSWYHVVFTGKKVDIDLSGLYEKGLPYWYIPENASPSSATLRVMPVFFHLVPHN